MRFHLFLERPVMARHVFLLALVYMYLPVTSGLVVPREWLASIESLCKQAEIGFFPHPSPHGQVLHGTFSPTLQSQVIKLNVAMYIQVCLTKLILLTCHQLIILIYMYTHICGTGFSLLNAACDNLVSTGAVFWLHQ